jgi:hypothetical protein
MTFEEASHISIKNSSSLKVSGLVLFRPYYVFEYKLDSIRIDKRGKTHRIKDEGLQIVDAITEFALSESETDITSNREHLLFSKKDKKDGSANLTISYLVSKCAKCLVRNCDRI